MNDAIQRTGLSWRELLAGGKLALAMLLLLVVLAVQSPSFFRPYNLVAVVSDISITGMLAVGMAMLMIAREFDISIGSTMALAGVIAVEAIPDGGVMGAVVSGLLVGLLAGGLNAWLVVGWRINSFIATLGTMVILQGIAFVLTDLRPVATDSETFQTIAKGRFLGIPLPVLYFASLSLLLAGIANYTQLGKYAYAIGGSPEASRMLGVAVGRQKTYYFLITGAVAGFTGVVLASRTAAASAVFGENVALVVIAAIVIGGVHLTGGAGTIGGVVQGVLLLGLLDKATVFLGFSDYYQKLFRALILLAVVVSDILFTKASSSRRSKTVRNANSQLA